jgi:dTMP kinase
MVSHTVLLVVGGALLTGVLGALLFGSNSTAEERRIREEQKLLRALEAQRRIRDRQLMRRAREQRQPHREPEPIAVEEVVAEEPKPDHRAAERQRKREEKEQAAALKAARTAEKHAQQEAEQERKAALKAEASERREADLRRRRDEKEKAVALKAEREARERAAALEATLPEPAPPTPSTAEEPDTPLAELPLFSWAHDIENDDAPSREAF